MEQIRDLDSKILEAVVKVKKLKVENASLQERINELESRAEGESEALRQRVLELESALALRDEEVRAIRQEKDSIKGQINELLSELDGIADL